MRRPSDRPGRDRRAERHVAAPGRAEDGRTHHVVVAGGGIAGLAAATALAERGVRVTLVEREPQLGGRVRSWPVQHGADTTTMSRGFHAFFRQYYNLRALLRRVDPELTRLVPVGDYPLRSSSGLYDSFAALPRTPPWNMVAFLLRSKAISLREITHIDPDAGHELVTVEFPEAFERYEHESAAHFLERLRFPKSAQHLALYVFSRSFFADPEKFSAGELIAMFHAYFVGSSEGLLFDVPDDDYDTALWHPLGDHLQSIGVDVRTGHSVESVRTGDTVVVGTDHGDLDADAVVLAADLRVTQQLVAADEDSDAEWRARVAALRSAPPFAVWRLWLDRPAAADRPAFLGTAGYGCVDNVSLLERFEAGAAKWAAAHDGSVVELHAYALPASTTDQVVKSEMRTALAAIYPELAGANALADEYVKRADCPLIGVGTWAARPPVRTPDPRVVLAGDGVRCDYPVALMERAATTGFQAANELLAAWGLAGHDLWTVPTRSRFPIRRRGGRQG